MDPNLDSMNFLAVLSVLWRFRPPSAVSPLTPFSPLIAVNGSWGNWGNHLVPSVSVPNRNSLIGARIPAPIQGFSATVHGHFAIFGPSENFLARFSCNAPSGHQFHRLVASFSNIPNFR